MDCAVSVVTVFNSGPSPGVCTLASLCGWAASYCVGGCFWLRSQSKIRRQRRRCRRCRRVRSAVHSPIEDPNKFCLAVNVSRWGELVAKFSDVLSLTVVVVF